MHEFCFLYNYWLLSLFAPHKYAWEHANSDLFSFVANTINSNNYVVMDVKNNIPYIIKQVRKYN